MLIRARVGQACGLTNKLNPHRSCFSRIKLGSTVHELQALGHWWKTRDEAQTKTHMNSATVDQIFYSPAQHSELFSRRILGCSCKKKMQSGRWVELWLIFTDARQGKSWWMGAHTINGTAMKRSKNTLMIQGLLGVYRVGLLVQMRKWSIFWPQRVPSLHV